MSEIKVKNRTVMGFSLDELKLINHGLCAACMEAEDSDYYNCCDELNNRIIEAIEHALHQKAEQAIGGKSDE